MIRSAKELSPDQKSAIESLLGRSVSEDEQISIRAIKPDAAPEWLQTSWRKASEAGLDQLSIDEIDAEIATVRRQRNRQAQKG
jgi:hypothetical protein